MKNLEKEYKKNWSLENKKHQEKFEKINKKIQRASIKRKDLYSIKDEKDTRERGLEARMKAQEIRMKEQEIRMKKQEARMLEGEARRLKREAKMLAGENGYEYEEEEDYDDNNERRRYYENDGEDPRKRYEDSDFKRQQSHYEEENPIYEYDYKKNVQYSQTSNRNNINSKIIMFIIIYQIIIPILIK